MSSAEISAALRRLAFRVADQTGPAVVMSLEEKDWAAIALGALARAFEAEEG